MSNEPKAKGKAAGTLFGAVCDCLDTFGKTNQGTRLRESVQAVDQAFCDEAKEAFRRGDVKGALLAQAQHAHKKRT